MITEDLFQDTVKSRLDLCQRLLLEKGKEYTRNDDRLHNFRSVAQRTGKTMLESLDGMLQKHLQSYYDMIEDVKAGKKIDKKIIDDKFTDIINYFLIAETIVTEHNEQR